MRKRERKTSVSVREGGRCEGGIELVCTISVAVKDEEVLNSSFHSNLQ